MQTRKESQNEVEVQQIQDAMQTEKNKVDMKLKLPQLSKTFAS